MTPTGTPVFFCQLIVDDTRLTARTDKLGMFVIDDVPIGQIGVDACMPGYAARHLVVRVPRDTLVVRLRRR